MEQAVWLYFGIIAVLVGIVIVAQLVGLNVEQEKNLTMNSSINQMANFCNFICMQDLNQLLSQEVGLVSGSEIYSTDQNGLCFEYKENYQCRDCKCKIYDARNFISDDPSSPNFHLNLDDPDIIQMYSTHKFLCVFFRERGGVTLECIG